LTMISGRPGSSLVTISISGFLFNWVCSSTFRRRHRARFRAHRQLGLYN
jgi:hypothetical protein